MEDFNVCLATDSYKIWHWKGYMPNTENNYGYLEARNGALFNKTVVFGLQSKKAIIHEKAITKYKGQLVETPDCCRRRCPYQAKVINTLLMMSNRIV